MTQSERAFEGASCATRKGSGDFLTVLEAQKNPVRGARSVQSVQTRAAAGVGKPVQGVGRRLAGAGRRDQPQAAMQHCCKHPVSTDRADRRGKRRCPAACHRRPVSGVCTAAGCHQSPPAAADAAPASKPEAKKAGGKARPAGKEEAEGVT